LFQSAFGSGTSKISAADEVFEKEGKGRQRQAACRNITRPQAMAEQVGYMIAVGCRRNACFELSAELYVDRAGENAVHENARADKKNPTEPLENGNPSGSSPCYSLLGFLLAALLRAALSRLIVLLLLTRPLPAALLSRILLPRLLILLALLIALALLGILVRIRHLSTSLV
jgi:hypothetical protein